MSLRPMLVWICNIAMVISVLMLALFTYYILVDDLSTKYAMGKIIEWREGERGTVPGAAVIAQYTNPDDQKTYTAQWNPIQGFGKKVGDELEVTYQKNTPDKFGRAYRGGALLNSRNGMVVFTGLLFLSLAIRLAMVGRLFEL